jgi:hypothetical protein
MGFRLIGCIFAAVGGIMLAVAAWSGNQKVKVIRYWPVVDATVVKSEANRHVDSDGDNMWRAEMEFRYVVNGKTYTTPATSDYSSSSAAEMRRMAARFPAGSMRPIKFNPAEPDDITFTYGYNFGFFFVPVLVGGMGLVFFPLGAVFVMISFRVQGTLKCYQCGCAVQKGQKYCSNCAAPVSPFA